MYLQQCKVCKGNHNEKDCPVLKSIKQYLPKKTSIISGATPPEVFVGRYNYPNVFAGILSPQQQGDTEHYSMPEQWHSKKMQIQDILSLRAELAYGRFSTNIYKFKQAKTFLPIMQEIAMTSKSTGTEMHFSKYPPDTPVTCGEHAR